MSKQPPQRNRDDKEMQRLSKLVEELLIIVAGSASLDKKGLMESQKDDEKFKHEVLKKLNGFDDRLKTMESYFRLPTNKTFWKLILFVLIVMLLVSNWTRDLYLITVTYIKKTYMP